MTRPIPEFPVNSVIVLRRRNNGSRFLALVVRITESGRIECRWERGEKAHRGQLTKPTLIDPLKLEIVGPAPRSRYREANHLRHLHKPGGGRKVIPRPA